MNRLCLWLCIALLIVGGPSRLLNAASDTQKLNSINKKIQLNRKKIQKKKKEKKVAERQLGKISRDLRVTKLKLRKTQKALKTVSAKERSSKKRLAHLQGEFNQSQQDFENRLVELYKHDNLGMVQYLLSPDAYISETDTSYYFDRLLQADIDLVNRMQGQYKSVQKQQRLLRKQREKIRVQKATISGRKQNLNRLEKKKKRYVQGLQSQIKKMESQNRQLEKSSRKLQDFIQSVGKGTQKYYAVGKFLKPVRGWLSSKYGKRKHPIFKRRIMHRGIDLAAPKGYRIRAANSGKVLVAGKKRRYRGYGNVTVIDHGKRKDGKRISTVYAHQSRILVKAGDFVKKGDEIGRVGATGYATGPHLHFEVRENGIPVNPLRYMKL